MIDFHTHLGDISFPNRQQKPLTADQLIDTMNRLGIEMSVLLPLDSPESAGAYFTTFEALKACEQYPERLIPFCCVDPRRDNVEALISSYVEMGCKGFGEHKMGLYIDDERCKKIYRICGERKLPVVFHLDPGLNTDEQGLPRLEKLLQEEKEPQKVARGFAIGAAIAVTPTVGVQTALALLLSLCIIGLGVFRPGRVEPDEKESLVVSVVQSEDCMLESYVDLTRTVRKESPDLIVWPECALPYDVRKVADDFAVLTNLCAEMDAILVFGTRTVVGPGRKDWYNTALILDWHGVLGEYYKARPVHLFNDGIPGDEFEPIQTDLGAFSTPICFDCDYSEVTRKMVKLGAEYFAVPSFDAQSWSAIQHFQHTLLFRLRAAETARWLACAASSGVSQIIDPHGNVHASLPPMETGVLTYRIGRSQHRTIFTRVGWLFPWLTLGCSVVLLTYAAITLIIRKGDEG